MTPHVLPFAACEAQRARRRREVPVYHAPRSRRLLWAALLLLAALALLVGGRAGEGWPTGDVPTWSER